LTNSYTQRPVEPSSLMPAFAAVVREAGVLARDAFGKPVRTWFKERSSPVSEADIAVDELLRKRLTALMPDAGWLSEETEDAPERLAVSRLFIVDPIDGTRAFLAGRADWAVSAALVE
jgi:myo-inositol-1(or 4)-monophosphatase